MRQQLVDPAVHVCGQARQHITEVIDVQRSSPFVQERFGVGLRSAFAKVVHHGFHILAGSCGMCPQISLAGKLKDKDKGKSALFDDAKENREAALHFNERGGLNVTKDRS